MQFQDTLVECLKLIATASIFFIWFVRYDNIKKEFKEFGYPTWLRDLVGILKISFIAMFYSSVKYVNVIGALGITILMLGAFLTHIKMKDSFRKTIASITMLSISITILFNLIS